MGSGCITLPRLSVFAGIPRFRGRPSQSRAPCPCGLKSPGHCMGDFCRGSQRGRELRSQDRARAQRVHTAFTVCMYVFGQVGACAVRAFFCDLTHGARTFRTQRHCGSCTFLLFHVFSFRNDQWWQRVLHLAPWAAAACHCPFSHRRRGRRWRVACTFDSSVTCSSMPVFQSELLGGCLCPCCIMCSRLHSSILVPVHASVCVTWWGVFGQ